MCPKIVCPLSGLLGEPTQASMSEHMKLNVIVPAHDLL